MTPGERAAAVLRDRGEEIARATTRALYAELPWLMEKYGARGRDKCLQDLRLNLEHLVPAVEMEAPEMYAAYARWVDGVLRSRGVPTAELARSMERMEEAGGEGMDDEARAVLARCLRAGVAALDTAGVAG